MTGILPTIVTFLILITGPLVESEEPDITLKEKEIKNILPIGYFGRWGEGRVVPELWFQKGSSAVLLCRISRLHLILEAHPEAKVTWLKDDLPLDNKRTFITKEGHLNITKLVRRRGRSAPENDEGVYRCLLILKREIEYMVSAPPITLHLAELSRHVTVSTTNASIIIEGTSLRLTCKAPSHPPAILLWQKDQVDLPHDDVRISQPTSGVLQIVNVKDEDGGIYRCAAFNDILNKTKYSDNVTVSVTSMPELPSSSSSTSSYIPPSFSYPTSNTTLRLINGWRGTLECSPYGLPFPTVKWQRKSIAAKEEDPWEDVEAEYNKRSFFATGHLSFDMVSVKDAGRYSCTASSRNPQTKLVVSASQEYTVVVIVTPVIASSPRNITTLMAKTVRLNCSIQQDPQMALLPPALASLYFPAPNIAWYKNGVPIQLDTRIEVREDNQLVFLNSGTSDTAIYQCLATNEAGYSTAWSYLLVNSSQDHPQPPKGLQVVLLSSTSVLLTWIVDSNPQSPVVGYSIHLTEHGTKPYESQVVSQVNSHIYEHLKPNTNYSFHVRAYSTLASDPSETVNFTTREAVPIAAPEFSLEVLSPSSLLVSWSPLPSDKARGTVDGYKIQWQRRKKDYYNLNEVGPDAFQHELQGLHPGKTYKVRVLARTKAGYNEGIDWPWKSITMPEVGDNDNTVTPLTPVMYVTSNEGSTEGLDIEISWQRHKNDIAPLTGYSLSFRKGDEPWSEPVILSPSHNSYTIPNIEPNWYTIKLYGFNEEGAGASAIDLYHPEKGDTNDVTDEDGEAIDGMPTIKNVQLVPERQTVVQLSWETSPVENKPIAFYRIKQEKFLNNGSPIVLYHKSLNNTITIDNLVPFITYQFAVRAHVSETEHGPYSQPIQTSTLRNTPLAPKEMNFQLKNSSSIEVRWDLPGLAPSKYQIAYTKNKTLSIPEWIHKEVKGTELSSTINGLDSNTEYWFRVRGCKNDACGSYSDSYRALIPSVLPQTADSSKIYLVVGVALVVLVLLLVIGLAIYVFKFRMTNPRPIIASNANGSVGNHGDGIRGHHHPGGRNGVTDLNGREGDYIPMLNRIHTDIPSTPLDTKGGYNNSRVNGFANPKCNGVVRGKEMHCGTNPHSKRDDSEERECLFPSSHDGDIVSRAHTEEGSERETESALNMSNTRKNNNRSPLPPLTQPYNDKEGVSRP